jgi:hypothetical protein
MEAAGCKAVDASQVDPKGLSPGRRRRAFKRVGEPDACQRPAVAGRGGIRGAEPRQVADEDLAAEGGNVRQERRPVRGKLAPDEGDGSQQDAPAQPYSSSALRLIAIRPRWSRLLKFVNSRPSTSAASSFVSPSMSRRTTAAR